MTIVVSLTQTFRNENLLDNISTDEKALKKH